MKIAIISSYGVYCGIARYTRHLVEEFLDEGHNVRVFARYKEKREYYGKHLKELPIKVIRCWPNKNIEKLTQELLEYNPDIIHFQDICRIKKMYKKVHELFPGKVVVTFHSVAAPKVSFHAVVQISDKTFVNSVKDYIDYYIVHNKLSKKFLIEKNKIPAKKVFVIDHGTLPCKKVSQKEARKRLKLPQDATIILTYGFFGLKKGIQEIIEVLPKIIPKIPNIYYVHFGRKRLGGKDRHYDKYEEIKQNIKKSGLQKKVKFLWKYGSEKEVQLYYRAADVIVIFYPRENPLLHASGVAHQIVSCERPVIASNVTTFSEFPKNSLYKIPRSTSALKKAIIEVLENKKFQKILTENALRYSKASSWKNTAKKHLVVFKKAK